MLDHTHFRVAIIFFLAPTHFFPTNDITLVDSGCAKPQGTFSNVVGRAYAHLLCQQMHVLPCFSHAWNVHQDLISVAAVKCVDMREVGTNPGVILTGNYYIC